MKNTEINYEIIKLGFSNGLEKRSEKRFGLSEFFAPESKNINVSNQKIKEFQSQQKGPIKPLKAPEPGFYDNIWGGFKSEALPETMDSLGKIYTNIERRFTKDIESAASSLGSSAKKNIAPYYMGFMAGQPAIQSLTNSLFKPSSGSGQNSTQGEYTNPYQGISKGFKRGT